MKKLSLFLFLFLVSCSIFAQTKQKVLILNEYYSFEMMDGNNIVGLLTTKNDTSYIVQSESIGEIVLNRAQVKSVKTMVEVAKGKAWFPNPHDTRYLFMPTAFTLPKGEAYYQNTYLFLNSINYGVTDRFTMGGGLNILGLFPTILPGQYMLTPKYSAPISERFHFGGGMLLGMLTTPPFFNGNDNVEFNFGGLLYTMGTWGTREKNFTLGLGYTFYEGEIGRSPLITFSGMTRLRKKLSFVSENWWVTSGQGVDGEGLGTLFVSYALRIFGEKMSVDLGFVNNREFLEFLPIGIPWIDFALRF